MGNQIDIPQEVPQENNSNNVLRDFAIEGWKGNGNQPFGNSIAPSMEAPARESLPPMTIAGDLSGTILNSLSVNSTRTDAHQESLTTAEDDFQGEHLLSIQITGDRSSAMLTTDQVNSRQLESQAESNNVSTGESRIVADEDLSSFSTLYIAENTQASLAADRQDFSSLPGSNSKLTGQTDSLLVAPSDLNNLSDAVFPTSQKSLSIDLTDVTASASTDTSNTRLTSGSDSYSSNNPTPNNSTEAIAYKAPTQNLLPQEQPSTATNPSILADTSNTRLAPRTESYSSNGSTPVSVPGSTSIHQY